MVDKKTKPTVLGTATCVMAVGEWEDCKSFLDKECQFEEIMGYQFFCHEGKRKIDIKWSSWDFVDSYYYFKLGLPKRFIWTH